MVGAQGEMIAELEEVLKGEMATSAVVREEIQSTSARLTRLGEEDRDRASGILTDTSKLVDETMDVVQSSEEEEDPEEEVPPGSPTVD